MNNKYNILINNKATCTVALVGNPNSGKTTLFNALTGSNQKVGNWPGVTVERKLGAYKQDSSVAIVDTPGIYSLTPFTPEETVARDYLTTGNPDVIINVVDSTNLERNLYLTTQLTELNIPVVVALNMYDEAQAKGIVVDCNALENAFNCQFVYISASKNTGIAELMDICLQAASKQKTAVGTARTAEQRYAFISQTLKKALNNSTVTVNNAKIANNGEKLTVTEKIDKIVLNKWLAFPIFVAIMTLVFYLSVGSVGSFLSGLINDTFTPALQSVVANWLSNAHLPWLTSLIVDGVIGGVMSVVGFLPQIILLFGCIALLEASGYMSRIAFMTDRLLNKIGLGGRSFVSMILGCGCSVPAIMATRTIKNTNERNTTITLAPFMPCSAKLAVISFFTSYILGGNALFAISFYFMSILAVILGGLLLKLMSRKKADDSNVFIMELPTYRLPTLNNVWKQMMERGKAFLIKAGTIIFVASVLLWLMTNFNFRFQLVETKNSMLASLGKLIAPIFVPLGWNDGGCGWQYSVATLTGIAAKETVVTTLNILLPQGINGTISGLGAYSYVAYNLLTVPCVATISTSFAEQGKLNGLKSLLFQICTAYIVSLIIYQLGTLFRRHTAASTVVVAVTATVIAIVFATRYIICHRGKCSNCNTCALKQHCEKQ
ncbi:MAG: ferrous iron transport protein B [Clostridiales bacterium]|nr:ferrous iron transport protein B [Clostridiales bacterium]